MNVRLDCPQNKRGNLACFWCTERFMGIPLHCPINRTPKGDLVCTEIVFCGFSCAKAHILRESHVAHDGYRRLSLLTELAKKHGHDSVITAPPRQALDKFGGPLSITQFRNPTQDLIVEPPRMLPLKIVPQPRMKRGDRSEPSVPHANDERLVLKRDRAPKRAKKITVWLSK